MDVGFRSVGMVFIISLSLSACGEKTVSSVLDENNYKSSACQGQGLSNRFIVQWENGQFSVESAADVKHFKKNFIEPNLESIRKVEYDRLVHFERESDLLPLAEAAPDDVWGQNMIEVASLWNEGVTGENVVVGVIDSYVDVSHPQLISRIAYNKGEVPDNGIDDDQNGYVDDYAGAAFISEPSSGGKVSEHGTHVSGVIAADHYQGSIKGMAPRARIIPAPFIDSVTGGSIGDAILAMQYASSRGAKIINASWGGAPCMESLKNAFMELNNKGILVVVAAGNDGRDMDYNPDYPAAFNMPNQITVAAATPSDTMVYWSNSGFNLVHLAAPGVDILSTITGHRTGLMSGTSMAAPFVSGAAALLWSDRPQAQVSDIKTALLRSVDVNPLRQYKVQTLGRVNVRKALIELRKLVPDSAAP